GLRRKRDTTEQKRPLCAQIDSFDIDIATHRDPTGRELQPLLLWPREGEAHLGRAAEDIGERRAIGPDEELGYPLPAPEGAQEDARRAPRKLDGRGHPLAFRIGAGSRARRSAGRDARGWRWGRARRRGGWGGHRTIRGAAARGEEGQRKPRRPFPAD